MALNKLPSQIYLRECFSYDERTGMLIWKERPRSHFNGNGVFIRNNNKFKNQPTALNKATHGYLRVGLDGNRYYLHRIIWKWMTNKEPIEIDHINRNSSDNRWLNLRDATRHQNAANTTHRGNKTGFKSVKFVTKNNNYTTQITVNGKYIHIGTFETVEDAHNAYCKAANHYFGDFWCGG